MSHIFLSLDANISYFKHILLQPVPTLTQSEVGYLTTKLSKTDITLPQLLLARPNSDRISSQCLNVVRADHSHLSTFFPKKEVIAAKRR